MIDKKDVLAFYEPEVKLTAKVLKAIPEDKLDFKLNEQSADIKQLMRTFVADMLLANKFIKGEQPSDNPFEGIEDFTTVTAGIEQFESKAKELIETINSTSEEDIAQPFSMWGMNGTRASMSFSLLLDMVHHRGQLSSYLRPAGGKVPSIYGPSADDNGGMNE